MTLESSLCLSFEIKHQIKLHIDFLAHDMKEMIKLKNFF